MDLILDEIERALRQDLYYLAAASALTLPDICATLQWPGEQVGVRYRGWYDLYLANKLKQLSAEEMYRVRCGLLHQGILDPPGMRRLILKFPDPGLLIHGSASPTYIEYEVVGFCQTVIAGVREWLHEKEHDAAIQKGLSELVQLRPDGLLPSCKGIPVIA